MVRAKENELVKGEKYRAANRLNIVENHQYHIVGHSKHQQYRVMAFTLTILYLQHV